MRPPARRRLRTNQDDPGRARAALRAAAACRPPTAESHQ
ncbi:MAG: hypothetical protein AVDCRST_MAG16-510 [uncultured Frankineae bacterium]|uniref:Uncharacterized protein n=1 Tax=uncultured Frankineae bacterium TaxID=437475 RepID=A0A6J4KY40_9ACTN|nr:MAG: hypothetical protein AVDCRST_MAG16-510 [uncultured Frankineae bacterium]